MGGQVLPLVPTNRRGMDEPVTSPALELVVSVTQGRQAGSRWQLRNFPAIIGRGEGADVRLEDDPRQPALSRRHVCLHLRNGRIFVEDLSTNGTAVGGRLLTPGECLPVDGELSLRLGQKTLLKLELQSKPVVTHLLSIRAFGPLEVELEGRRIPDTAWESRQAAILLVYLALQEGRGVAAERLITDLWPNATGGKAALQSAVSRLRRALRTASANTLADPVRFERQRYFLNPVYQLDADVVEFTRLCAQGRFDLARMLVRGAFLESFSDEWVLLKREHFEREHLEATARQAEELPVAQAIELYRHELAEHPLWEAGHLRLLELLAQEGRRDEAVRHYHGYTRTFKTQLQMGPSPAMLELYTRLTR